MNPSFDELFTTQFMHENTAFDDIQDFFDAVGVSDSESFQALPEDKLERHVQTSTNFSSWSKMQEAAATEYLENKLNF